MGGSGQGLDVELVAGTPAVGVGAHHVGNGLVVRLSGVLDGQAVPALRAGLLRTLPEGCRDVLVDTAGVEAVEDEALAVLVAGSAWARSAGARFALSSVSPVVARELNELELAECLPVLSELR